MLIVSRPVVFVPLDVFRGDPGEVALDGAAGWELVLGTIRGEPGEVGVSGAEAQMLSDATFHGDPGEIAVEGGLVDVLPVADAGGRHTWTDETGWTDETLWKDPDEDAGGGGTAFDEGFDEGFE